MTAPVAAAALQVLSFQLGEETFAIDVTRAREILDFSVPTKVPQTPKFMLGVINLRGSVVPVIDLRLKFGMVPAERTLESCIIVLEVLVEGQLATVGAVADAVQEVLELEGGRIEPPPRLGTSLKTEFIKGIGNIDGDFLILLDIDRIFSAEEASLGLETSDASLPAAV